MRHDWRSDHKPPVPPSGEIERLLSRLKDVDSELCERCKARALDPMCPSCLEIALKELEAK